MKRCPACRRVLPDESMLLCPYDGTPLLDTIVDPKAFANTEEVVNVAEADIQKKDFSSTPVTPSVSLNALVNDISDVPTNKFTESEIARFDSLKNFAYGGIFVVAGVAISLNGFAGMWDIPTEPIEIALFVSRAILFAELLILAFRWVFATHHEMNMWIHWLYNPLDNKEIYAAMFSLSFFLGLSIAFPHRIGFLSGFITVSFLFVYWAQWLANNHFEEALRITRGESLSSTKSKVLDIMETYWLKRPLFARVTIMMFFSSLAFSLAIVGLVQHEPQRQRYQLVAYIILILDVFIGEAVITGWRLKRDKDIKQAIGSN
jgi:hypothetical protein